MGSSAVNRMSSGRQMAPIFLATWSLSWPASSDVRGDAFFDGDEGGDGLALDLVGAPDHGGFGDARVVHQGRFHLHRADVVAGDQHDVVHAAQQPVVAFLVAPRAVAGEVVALLLELAPVDVLVALVVAPDASAAWTARAG